MGPFNHREVATAIWLLVAAWLALRKPEVRKSLLGVLRAFCHAKILGAVVLLALYVTGLVFVLRHLAMWDITLLKDTIIWFCVGGFAMIMRFTTADDTTGLFRKILGDSVKVVIVLEFLVNTYTFPLGVELVLVPALTFVALIDVVASINEEHAIVAKLARRIETVAGLAILAIAIGRAIADLQTLSSLATIRSIALAPVLSVCMYPFAYLMLVISQYEQLFIRLDLRTERSTQFKRYVRRRVMMYAGLRLDRLRRLQRHHMLDLMRAETTRDVDQLIRECSS